MLLTDSFATRVREESMAEHREAETSTLMSDVFSGRVTEADYASLLCQLQAVYSALDSAAASARHNSQYADFFHPGLDRTAAIAADLTHLPASTTDLTPETIDYVGRIRAASDSWLGLLVAHHYTRYLGDLSGGQAIAAKLAANLGLTPDRGLALYQFPEIGPAPRFKAFYRDLLDNADWSAEQRDDFIAEVKVAYQLNLGVFRSLDARR